MPRGREITREQLRRQILNALPEVAPKLETLPLEPHNDVDAVAEFAWQALRANDQAATIRCFSLLKRLFDFADDLDMIWCSALHTTFRERFARDDPTGLEVFRKIEPNVRRDLYSPFVFPHTWFSPRLIATASYSGTRWIIRGELEHRSRVIQQRSCPSRFADITLRAAPNPGIDGVLFCSAVPKESSLPLLPVETVCDTIASQTLSLAERGVVLVGTTICLSDARWHPVDSTAADVQDASKEAFAVLVAHRSAVDDT